MDENKYDLQDTVQDIFKCLLYGYLLTILLMLIREVIVTLSAIPPEIMKEIEPILIYLEDGLPSLYLFIRLGRDYGVSIKQCFKRVSIKGRELVALCCFDTGIVGIFFIILLLVLMAITLLMPSLLEVIENIPIDDTGAAANVVTAVILAPLFEEIVFRGIMLNVLKPHGTRFAILLTTFVFALMHPGVNFIAAFFAGILLAHITLYYNSILPAILMHFLHNGLISLPNELLIALSLILPLCFFYFLFKGDYKKYFSISMTPNAEGCWHSLLTPGKILFVLVLLMNSFMGFFF